MMTETGPEIKATSLWCSSRLALAVLAFFGFVNLYASRASMGIAIVCMTHQPVSDLQKTCHNHTDSGEDRAGCNEPYDVNDGKFDWDKKTQGFVLSSFYWGYWVTQVPGGWLAGRYGGKRVIGWSMFGCAVATLLIPIATQMHVVNLMVLRCIAGLTQGFILPSLLVMWAHWAPPLERTKLSSLGITGAAIGNVVAFPISGLLCSHGFAGGWPSIFYTFGILGVLLFICWMFIVYDSPLQHPRISPEERSYIVNSLKSEIDVSETTKVTPWKKIFTSFPVWAIIVAGGCAEWGFYSLLTYIPSYMNDVLDFQINKTGFLSAVPYLGLWAMANGSALFADFLRSRQCVSTVKARKVSNSVGSLIPAVFLVMTGYVDDKNTAVAFLTISVSIFGCVYGSGYSINALDIAPRYTGVIFGFTNMAGSLGGLLGSLAIGLITEDRTREQWQYVFIITAGIYTFGAIFFIIFASGSVQSWALDEEVTLEDIDLNITSSENNSTTETQISYM